MNTIEYFYSCRTTTTAESSTEDYDDYEPLFSLGLRSPRQVQGRKQQHWEVQDINCQGIPFTTIPGKSQLSSQPAPFQNQQSGSRRAF